MLQDLRNKSLRPVPVKLMIEGSLVLPLATHVHENATHGEPARRIIPALSARDRCERCSRCTVKVVRWQHGSFLESWCCSCALSVAASLLPQQMPSCESALELAERLAAL